MSTIPPWRKGQNVKQRSEKARRKPNSPAPEERVYRRNYLVDRLPPKVQARVFRMYARGVPYRTISERLRKMGYAVHHAALSRYWRHVWHKEHQRLIQARGVYTILKEAFELDPKSPSGQFAQELFYTMLVNKLKELEAKKPEELVEEARAQDKMEGGKKEQEGKTTKRSAASEAKEVRRRWRELYGMNKDEEEEDKKE